MSRLPNIGGDDGSWGTILNDFLSQCHAADGTLNPQVIGAPQLKQNAVTSAAIAPGAVTGAALASGAITSASLPDGSITTSKLQDGAVTSAKLDKYGQANGVASLDGNAKLPTAQIPDLSSTYLTPAAGTAAFVPRWQPNTAYTLGQQVVSPNNDVVSAITAHTSGTTFTPVNWQLSTTYAPASGSANYAPASLVTTKLDATAAASTYAPLGGNIQATVRKLADDFADVTILVLGDSTAAQTDKWPYVMMPMLQALYPYRTLKQSVWNTTTSAYDAPTTIVTGTGTNNINFYQGAVSGTVYESALATWDKQVAAVQPDLVMVHSGHNYGATAAAGGYPDNTTMDYTFTERATRFVAMVKASCPTADVFLNSQNPYLTTGTRTNLSNIRAQVQRGLCVDLGCGYGPVLEAFLATGNSAAYINSDGLHPNAAGSLLTANTLLQQFHIQPNMPPSPRIISPLLIPTGNFLTNGDLSQFAAPPTLTGWTAQNTTLSKNTSFFESKNGYSLQMVVTGTAGTSMYQIVPQLKRYVGQVVTFAVRLYVPSTSTASAGRLTLSGDGGLVTKSSGTLTNAFNTWVWASVTLRVPLASTYLTAQIIPGGAGTTTDKIYVDRAVLVLGHLLRDIQP